MIRLPYKFYKYKDLFIRRFFDYIIRNRIENKLVLIVFYFIFLFLQYFYREQPHRSGELNHYIPRPILANFAMSNNKGQLWEYGNGLSGPTGVAIKRTAQIPNYYSFKKLKDGQFSNFVEKNLFAEIVERFGHDVISDLLIEKYKDQISLEENILATYASFQYVRTPAFAEQLKVYLLYFVQEKGFTQDFFSNKNKKKLKKLFTNITATDNENVVKFYLKSRSSGTDYASELSKYLENVNAVINAVFGQVGSSNVRALFNKKKTLIEVQNPYFFILPDSGVMVVDLKRPGYLWPYGWDFQKRSTLLFLPLSPQKCLVFHDNRLKLDRDLTEMFVKLAISSAYIQRYKCIYSDRRNLFIQRNIDNINPIG